MPAKSIHIEILCLMPRALCEFVDPQLSNVALRPSDLGQHLTTGGQQIRIMLKVSGLICFCYVTI